MRGDPARISELAAMHEPIRWEWTPSDADEDTTEDEPTMQTAIAVRDDRGHYEFYPNTREMPLNTLGGVKAVTLLEKLRGWGKWTYAVRIEGQAGTFFITGELPS